MRIGRWERIIENKYAVENEQVCNPSYDEALYGGYSLLYVLQLSKGPPQTQYPRWKHLKLYTNQRRILDTWSECACASSRISLQLTLPPDYPYLGRFHHQLALSLDWKATICWKLLFRNPSSQCHIHPRRPRQGLTFSFIRFYFVSSFWSSRGIRQTRIDKHDNLLCYLCRLPAKFDTISCKSGANEQTGTSERSYTWDPMSS
jgi:hypothetical protein